MDSNMMEKLILKSVYDNEHYLVLVATTFKPDYFDDSVIGKMIGDISKHFLEYSTVFPRDILCGDDEDRKNVFKELDAIDFDAKKNYDFLYKETDEYLREKAVKNAILESADVINNKKDILSIYGLLEDALCKTLKVGIGLDYFATLSERLKRLMTMGNNRLTSGFPTIDEYLNGGFPPCTLSVILARIHGFKSSFMANVSARQVLSGANVAMLSLEMSEDMYSQRYDGIFSGLNINRIYVDDLAKKEMIKAIGEIKQPGKLIIKQLPTGKASANDVKVYLKELKLRGIKLGALYCDYLNLMKPSYRKKKDMYTDVKDIAEELRALSFEFDIPIISVSQLNREGMGDIDLTSIDIVHTSESMALPATVDFLGIFGRSEELRLYENEIYCKIVKNRMGGRVGEIFKLFHDTASLKIYDPSELDQWRVDSIRSGDSRNIANKNVRAPKGLGKKSRNREGEE